MSPRTPKWKLSLEELVGTIDQNNNQSEEELKDEEESKGILKEIGKVWIIKSGI